MYEPIRTTQIFNVHEYSDNGNFEYSTVFRSLYGEKLHNERSLVIGETKRPRSDRRIGIIKREERNNADFHQKRLIPTNDDDNYDSWIIYSESRYNRIHTDCCSIIILIIIVSVIVTKPSTVK